VLIYVLLCGFLYIYAKKIEKPIVKSQTDDAFVKDRHMDLGLTLFAVLMGLGILTVLSSVFFTALQDYTMIIVAITFLVSGIVASIVSKKAENLLLVFWNGITSVFPAVFMILMANSIKYTMIEGNILNPILEGAIGFAQTLPWWCVILCIYLIVLVMNFFISSGSAKAFLLMPLILPVAKAFGISSQLCILAFAFGDGFSNVFYPTNPVLLISLGLADVNYGKWAKWSWKFQTLNLLLTSGLLLLGLVIGY
jgi:uncharacterized ion transporter superfamily protein YfcC